MGRSYAALSFYHLIYRGCAHLRSACPCLLFARHLRCLFRRMEPCVHNMKLVACTAKEARPAGDMPLQYEELRLKVSESELRLHIGHLVGGDIVETALVRLESLSLEGLAFVEYKDTDGIAIP